MFLSPPLCESARKCLEFIFSWFNGIYKNVVFFFLFFLYPSFLCLMCVTLFVLHTHRRARIKESTSTSPIARISVSEHTHTHTHTHRQRASSVFYIMMIQSWNVFTFFSKVISLRIFRIIHHNHDHDFWFMIISFYILSARVQRAARSGSVRFGCLFTRK